MSQDAAVEPVLMPAVFQALGLELARVAVDSNGRVAAQDGPVAAQDGPVAAQDGRVAASAAAWQRFGPELRMARSGSVQRWEGWLSDPDGRTCYVERVFGPGSTAGEVLVVTRDVTDHKHREQSLERRIEISNESQTAAASVVASSLDSIVIVDAEGCVLEFNPAAEATFGYKRHETLGRPIADLIIPASMREQHRRGMERYERTGVPHMLNRRVELEAMRADGTLFPVELSIVDLTPASGRRYAAHLRDLTIVKAAQRELDRQQVQLREAERLGLTASLLSGVAHELNNPLAILLAQTTLLQSRAETEDARIRAGKIHAAAERAARIIKSFLDLACERPPERRRTEIHPIIQGALDMTAYGRRSAGIELVYEPAASSGSVLADAHLLGQAMTMLLVVATEAVSDQPGARSIRLATRSGAETVSIELDHNGPAPPEGGGEPALSRAGLAVPRDIVASHAGTLSVARSQDGRTCFSIVLPSIGSAQHERAGDRADDTLSILIIDDEREVAEALADMLGIMGYRTSVADNAADALARADDRSVDLIFADLRMPVINGVDLYRRIVERRPDVEGRFVLVSGDAAGAIEAIRDGAPDGGLLLLEKPFSTRSVRAVLERARLPGPSSEPAARN